MIVAAQQISGSWSDIIAAVGAAGFGGVVLKIVEKWMGRSKAKQEQDKQFRDELQHEKVELRIEVDALKKEIKNQEVEFDRLREKYWSIYMEYRMFQIEVSSILLTYKIDPKDVIKPDHFPEINSAPYINKPVGE